MKQYRLINSAGLVITRLNAGGLDPNDPYLRNADGGGWIDFDPEKTSAISWSFGQNIFHVVRRVEFRDKPKEMTTTEALEIISETLSWTEREAPGTAEAIKLIEKKLRAAWSAPAQLRGAITKAEVLLQIINNNQLPAGSKPNTEGLAKALAEIRKIAQDAR
jgi:hypothetical protein